VGRHLAHQCLNLWLLRVFRGYQAAEDPLRLSAFQKKSERL